MQAVIENMNGPTEAKFGKKYGFLLNGQWHDYFTKFPLPAGCTQGATIETDVEANGTYNPKIKRIKVLTPGSGPVLSDTTGGVGSVATGHTERELSIMRQNAMTNANTFLSNNSTWNEETQETYSLKALLETATILTSFYEGKITYEDLQEEKSTKPSIAELAKSMAS